MTLYSVASVLLQGLAFPPGLLVVGLALGAVAAMRGRWRLAFVVIAVPVAATLVMALPWAADRIVMPLEQRALADSRSALASRPLPRTAVVLGGVVGIAGPDERAAASGYDLSDAADRVTAAARLFRAGDVDRLVLAGGSADATSEAELTARFAVDLGVPRVAMLLEPESRSTRENALRVADVLREHRLGPDIALVTSGLHLPRAMAAFRCAGLAPVGVPAEFEVLGAEREFPYDWVPSLGAIDRARRGLKEWAGNGGQTTFSGNRQTAGVTRRCGLSRILGHPADCGRAGAGARLCRIAIWPTSRPANMPRRARIMLAGVAAHLVQRGNNRGACFFSQDDYRFYLRHLHAMASATGCAVHAYCLMTNHIHLLLTPDAADGCGRLMKGLGQRYVQYVNRTYRRSGTLWEGRFWSCLAQTEDYVLACYRYIELNPVRAAMVAHPRDYPWSSYRVNADGSASNLIAPHDQYRLLGRDVEERRERYRDLLRECLDPDIVTAIREATNGNCALGTARFQAEVEAALGRRAHRGKPGRPKMGTDHVFEQPAKPTTAA